MKPVEYFLLHKEEILEAYQRHGGSPKQTWEELIGTLPDMAEVMSFNTFKQYVTFFADVMEAQKKAVWTTLGNIPKKIDGWNVIRDKAGFIRLRRRFGKEVKSLYIGRTWDERKALNLIQFKERDLHLEREMRKDG